MKINKSISVIIPTKNRHNALMNLLKSFISQDSNYTYHYCWLTVRKAKKEMFNEFLDTNIFAV